MHRPVREGPWNPRPSLQILDLHGTPRSVPNPPGLGAPAPPAANLRRPLTPGVTSDLPSPSCCPSFSRPVLPAFPEESGRPNHSAGTRGVRPGPAPLTAQ